MSMGLIIPASTRDALRIIEDLEPGSSASYARALGGVELHALEVVPNWGRHINLFAGFDLTGQCPLNRRAQWFSPGRRVRGDVLFTGVDGEDLPLPFLDYLDDMKLIGSTLDI